MHEARILFLRHMHFSVSYMSCFSDKEMEASQTASSFKHTGKVSGALPKKQKLEIPRHVSHQKLLHDGTWHFYYHLLRTRPKT